MLSNTGGLSGGLSPCVFGFKTSQIVEHSCHLNYLNSLCYFSTSYCYLLVNSCSSLPTFSESTVESNTLPSASITTSDGIQLTP